MSQGLCPSCGAAVSPPAGQTETKCQYCETVVTLQQAEAQSARLKSAKGGGALLLANIALTSCDYAKALTFYDKAIEQDETLAEAWLGRGTCFANIRNQEYGSLRTNTTEALSSLDAAIQFAPNQQAMAKRAAKVIAEAVAAGLRVEVSVGGGKERRNFFYNDADYNALLAWAIEKDSQGGFLLKTGAEFYSRATPYQNAKRAASPPTGEFKDSIEEFYTSLNLNHDKFLQALRQVNPEAAGKLDNTLRKSQPVAQAQFKKENELRAEAEELPQSVVELIRKGGAHKIEAIKELLSIRPGLGLAEAKKLVEETGAQLGTMSASKGSCFVATASGLKTAEPPVIAERRYPGRIPTALCAILLGWLGIHKFMLGYTKEGFIQLILGVFCLVGFIIGVIEGIIYLAKSDEEFNRTYVQAKRAWF
jgi:ribosomal protein L7/L12/TM2 domain-containing membrane protein YozV